MILTLPQDEAEAPSIGNNQLQIERLQIREEKVLTVADNHRGSVRLAVRRTNANYALIRLNQPSSNRLEALPSSKETMDNLDRVAIFHFTGNGKLELIFVPCAYKDGRLNFDAPVDNTAFGSPVIGPKGILGMVQEELSGMPVSEISN